MSRTLLGFHILFHSESYPKTAIRAFSKPRTLGSQSGQKELDSGCVQVPFAEPPKPWTKMMSTGSELRDGGGSKRTCNPKLFGMAGVAGVAGGLEGGWEGAFFLLLDQSWDNFSGYMDLISRIKPCGDRVPFQ
jgi:hypothetical protein